MMVLILVLLILIGIGMTIAQLTKRPLVKEPKVKLESLKELREFSYILKSSKFHLANPNVNPNYRIMCNKVF